MRRPRSTGTRTDLSVLKARQRKPVVSDGRLRNDGPRAAAHANRAQCACCNRAFMKSTHARTFCGTCRVATYSA